MLVLCEVGSVAMVRLHLDGSGAWHVRGRIGRVKVSAESGRWGV